jgi:hypothetical protein
MKRHTLFILAGFLYWPAHRREWLATKIPLVIVTGLQVAAPVSAPILPATTHLSATRHRAGARAAEAIRPPREKILRWKG